MASPSDPRDHLPPFLRPYCPSQEQCRAWSAKCQSAIRRLLTQSWRYAYQRWQRLDRTWRVWCAGALLAAMFLPLLFVFGHRSPVQPTPIVAADAKPSSKAEVNDEQKNPPHVEVLKEFRYQTPPPRPFVPETDAIIAEAYAMQQRFVTREVPNSPYVWGPDISIYYVWKEAGCPNPGPGKWLFSPPTETIIARSGNLFRVRGWVTFKSYRPDNKPNDNQDATLSYVCHMILDPELGTWKLSGHIEKID